MKAKFKAFGTSISTNCSKGVRSMIGFLKAFKNTRLATKAITVDIAKLFTCLIMAAGVLISTAFAGKQLGLIWGIGTFVILGCYVGFLYKKYLYAARTIPSILDGSIAIGLLFSVVLAVTLVSLYLIVKMTVWFNSGVGTLTFLFCGIVVVLFMYRFATISEEVEGEM